MYFNLAIYGFNVTKHIAAYFNFTVYGLYFIAAAFYIKIIAGINLQTVNITLNFDFDVFLVFREAFQVFQFFAVQKEPTVFKRNSSCVVNSLSVNNYRSHIY